MKTKLKQLLGSMRFWIVSLTAITAILQSVSGGFDFNAILEIIKVYLVTVAGIGTLDSVAEKFGSKTK